MYACGAGAPAQVTRLAGLQAPHMLNNNANAVSLQFPVATALLFLILLLYLPHVNGVKHYLSFASLSLFFNIQNFLFLVTCMHVCVCTAEHARATA